jgi:hypothetical protein
MLNMVSPKLSPPFDDFLDYLIEKVTPQEILAYQASEAEQERANELLERGSAGELTPDELAELDRMLQSHRLVSVMKARALEMLSKS